MSACPAYLYVSITDLVLYEQLFSYDLLVLCPTTFNVSFRFPIPSTRDSMTSSFDVQLSDAARSHHVYLTQVDLLRLGNDHDDDERSQAVVFHRRVSPSTSSSWDHSWLFFVVAVVIVALALLSAFLHADRHLRPVPWIDLTSAAVNERRPSPSACTYHLCRNGHAGRPLPLDNSTASPFYRCSCRSAVHVVSRRRYRLLVCAYASLWVVTGLLATFNVFFYVVGVLVDRDWRRLATMAGDGQAEMARVRRTAESNLSLLVDGHRRDELLRYRDGVVERARACRSHVDNTIRRTSATLASESAQVTDVGWSIAARTAEQSAGRLAAYGARVDAFTAEFQTKLSAAVGRTVRRYGTYVNSLVDSVWLRFAVDVFNSTDRALSPSNHVNYYGHGDQAMARFGSFLDIDEVKQVEAWVVRFWQRYEMKSLCVRRLCLSQSSLFYCIYCLYIK